MCKINPLWSVFSNPLVHILNDKLAFRTCNRSIHSVSQKWGACCFSYFRFSGSSPFKEPLMRTLSFSFKAVLHAMFVIFLLKVCQLDMSSLFFVRQISVPYVLEACPCLSCPVRLTHVFAPWDEPLRYAFTSFCIHFAFEGAHSLFRDAYFALKGCTCLISMLKGASSFPRGAHYTPPSRELILFLQVFMTSSHSRELFPFRQAFFSPFSLKGANFLSRRTHLILRLGGADSLFEALLTSRFPLQGAPAFKELIPSSKLLRPWGFGPSSRRLFH